MSSASRLVRWVTWSLLLVSAAFIANCGGDDSSGGDKKDCAPNDTRTCVGPGACNGGQACGADGTWGACDCTGATGGTGGAGGAATGGSGGADGSAGSGGASGGQDGGGTGGGNTCGQQVRPAAWERTPVDVVFIVDNSCSMDKEILSIESSILGFTQDLAAANVDYRLVMISEHGPIQDRSICVPPPVGGGACPALANTAPTSNPPIFYHYDNGEIGSVDSWCKLLDSYDKPDRYNLAPNGWSQWLRKGSFKTFVEVTDDRVTCTTGSWSYDDLNTEAGGLVAGDKFDKDLLARDPSQFGTGAARNYAWYSLIGVPANPALTTDHWSPTEPMASGKCGSAVNAGTGYQRLSKITGGWRYPICDTAGYAAVFGHMAKRIENHATVFCQLDLPPPPAGSNIDPGSIQFLITPSGGGAPEIWPQVASAAACTGKQIYVEAGKVKLCAAACDTAKADPAAKLETIFGCL